MSRFYTISGTKGSIAEKYDLKDRVLMSRLMVIRKDTTRVDVQEDQIRDISARRIEPTFTVFGSKMEFLYWYERLDDDMRVYHEYIFDTDQKLHFDIDVNRKNADEHNYYGGTADDFEVMFKDFIEGIKLQFSHHFDDVLEDKDIVICDSSSDSKFSRHVVINGYSVSESRTAKKFAEYVKDSRPNMIKFIDNVYKAPQGMRLTGSHKLGDVTRSKRIISDHTLRDSLITDVVNCKRLPTLCDMEEPDKRETKPIVLTGEDKSEIREILTRAGIYDSFYQRQQQHDDRIYFDRIRGAATMCPCCHREHDSRGFLCLIEKDGDACHVKYRCYVNPVTALLGTFVTTVPGDLKKLAIQTSDRLTKTLTKPWVEHKLNFSTAASGIYQHVYSEPELRDFELCDTLFVHAPMKIGKTKKLVKFIDEHFATVPGYTPVIRFMSFRQTFTHALAKSFPNFRLYSDVQGGLTDPQLIVQIESLDRLVVNESTPKVNLLILDECESVFGQFNSGLVRDLHVAFENFCWMVRNADTVVCMDANMTNRTFNIIKRLRSPDAPFSDAIYHRNEFKNATSDTYQFASYDKWWSTLKSCVEADEKIVVMSNSLDKAKVITAALKKNFRNKIIQQYNSETSSSEKRRDFADVNNIWLDYDILVYTPTLSAGVSFERKHFDRVFAYFTDMSCDAETCIQMLGRIRDVKSKTYVMCMQCPGNNLETSPEGILSELINGRGVLYDGMDARGLPIVIDDKGHRSYQNTAYLCVWLQNISIARQSRNDMIGKFVYLVKQIGACAEQLSDDKFFNYTGYDYIDKDSGDIANQVALNLTELSVAKNELDKTRADAVCAARDLLPEEYELIRERKRLDLDVSEQDQRAYDRCNLRKIYDLQGELTTAFVIDYSSDAVIRKFRNLGWIWSMEDIAASLDNIKQVQADSSAYLNEIGRTEEDLNRNQYYNYVKHLRCHQIVQALGFSSIRDEKYVPLTLLRTNDKEEEKRIQVNAIAVVKNVCSAFELKVPQDGRIANAYIDCLIKAARESLNWMYGMSIVSSNGMLSIKASSLFRTSVGSVRPKGM